MTFKKRLSELLDKIHLPSWLMILLTVVIILRIPSFFEPYAYGDEMIYLTMGQGIRQAVPIYKELHDNKPPLIYLLAAVAGSLFWFKVILAVWSLATTIIFWKLLNNLYPKKDRLIKVGTCIFAILTTIPLFEGNIANAELFMIGPTILAFLILLGRSQTPKNLLLAGVLFSTSALFKIPGAFDIGAIIFFWLLTLTKNKKSITVFFQNTAFLFAGFILPILLTLGLAAGMGVLKEYFVAVFTQNVGYLSSWRPGDTRLPFMTKNLPLIIRGLVLLTGLLILYWKKKKLPKEFIFVCAWLLFGLFSVTLSERPYPHYFVQVLPAVSILLTLLFTDKTLVQSLTIIPLALAFFVPVYYKFWYYPTSTYYLRFVRWATGNLSKTNYLNSFGDNIAQNYEFTKVVINLTEKNDRIFVWGDDAKIYALSRRLPSIKYATDYHIRDFSNLEQIYTSLEADNPKLVIWFNKARSFPKLRSLLMEKYLLLSIDNGVEMWKLINPQVHAAVSSR